MPSIFNGFAVAVLMVACLVGTRINAAVITITEGSTSGYTMTDGNTYIIQDSVSFSNSIAGGSGMSVEENATVVLYVPDGVTLTAIGANGSGQIGGGAGIHVPETATLVITGEGTVNATGGNAGDGGNGVNGGNGYYGQVCSIGSGSCSYREVQGSDGNGGIGGGGAASGIGGNGGLGGMPNGGDGGDGYAMGNVYIMSVIVVCATKGEAGIVGTNGKSGSQYHYEIPDASSLSGYKSGYVRGGSGGGGGGAGISPMNAIGGGGAGGGAGNKGNATCGAVGTEGDAGVLYVSPTATVNVEREKLTAITHPAVPQYTITFNPNGGEFSSEVESLTATLGDELPDCIPAPTRSGYKFDGWRTVSGEEYYGPSGTKRKATYSKVGDIVLYAQWRSTVLPNSAFWIRDNAETGWFVDSQSDEVMVFRSGEIGSNTNSWMETTIVGPASFSFDWKVSCNTRGHYLAWFIDGVEQERIKGEAEWEKVCASVPEGEHIVRFVYVKGSTSAAGEDKGQVRNFAIDSAHIETYAYSTALDSGWLLWNSAGDANWVAQGDVSHDGASAVRSGEVIGDDISTLSTIVTGPGTLSWWWKLDMTDCAGVDVFVDGSFVASLDYVSDWKMESIEIGGEGKHTVRFEFWNAGTEEALSDHAYMDQVSWVPIKSEINHTATTPVPIPHSYFEMNYPTLLGIHGGDYESAALSAAANGRKVWECFMLGVDPMKADDDFKITRFWMENGEPKFEFSHSADGAGNSFAPRIKPLGKEKLSDSWQDVPLGGNPSFRFFTVEVELP